MSSRSWQKRLTAGVVVSVSAVMWSCGGSSLDVVGPDAEGAQSAPLTGTAPSADAMGPYDTDSAEYKFAAAVDPLVLDGRETELWARVYFPDPLPTGKRPLAVFLHGNHATCGRGSNPRVDDNTQYTMRGTCPAGYTVVPNHLGYTYLAERLASWGYVVVSINANRGITAAQGVRDDFGLNLARGRLVLRHLQRLSEWNQGDEATPRSLGIDLTGKLDFEQVGLMGHSRGGEGVRAAYNQYLDAGSPWPALIPDAVKIRGIYEIGPVDGQTSRVLNAVGTAWNVLLPMCDGDVSNLQGMKPFDRMMAEDEEATPTPKSLFAVWGTNHNFYNTEWQQSDSFGCNGHSPIFDRTQIGSPEQRATASGSLMAFFRGFVGAEANASFAQNFDPQYGLPTALTQLTRFERAYADAVDADFKVDLEDFTGAVGQGSRGVPHTLRNVDVRHGAVPEHDAVLKAAQVSWEKSGTTTYFQVNWGASRQGLDLSGMDTIDFRVSRARSNLNPATDATEFSIQLVNDNGRLTQRVPLSEYAELMGPAGHAVLQSVRIPLSRFVGLTPARVRGLRLVFNGTATGSIYVAGVRASRGVPAVQPPALEEQGLPPTEPQAPSEPVSHVRGNALLEMRAVANAAGTEDVEIELGSAEAFDVKDALPLLRVGEQTVALSRYPEAGNTDRLIFTLSAEEYRQLQDGAEVAVEYGRGTPSARWPFGNFRKSALLR